jgi:restriction system protein
MLGGVLESPRRGLFLITDLGRKVVALQDSEAHERLKEIDHAVRRARRRKPQDDTHVPPDDDAEGPPEDDERWKEVLLARLHKLSPDAFEHFVLYVLRAQGMELKRVGGSGDEGVDGIGKAPLSGVLSTTIAVQGQALRPLEDRGTRNRGTVSK